MIPHQQAGPKPGTSESNTSSVEGSPYPLCKQWIAKLTDACLELQALREWVVDVDLVERERELWRWKRQQELVRDYERDQGLTS